jgi:vacuolar-type H+-ATPase subunit H
MSEASVSKLMQAESDAKAQIDDAKKERDRLLKMADAEAREQIEQTRRQKQAEYDEILSKSATGDSAERAALDGATQKQISKLTSEASKHKEEVISYLTGLVQQVNTDFVRYVKPV